MHDRWIDNRNFIIEEYIDGDMYTVNYFVNEKWEIFYSPIVKVNSSQKLWINDFSNYVRLNWKVIDDEINFNDVKLFVEKNVKTFDIKNTFIHHEFKLNSNKKLINIEINARIWGYRLEMMQNMYWFNLLTMPLWKSLEKKLKLFKCSFCILSKKYLNFKMI